ncbi:MAG: hypothetical protein HYU03_06845 [Thaumarchaeota archaeon]|nr:hypothetical protein [Nitrososphaerota archaeon]MCS4540387.1 hypothetical protein [Nitrososphaerota archaeon]
MLSDLTRSISDPEDAPVSTIFSPKAALFLANRLLLYAVERDFLAAWRG